MGRPKDQKKFFSVKKGTHTLKTQVAVTPDGLVVHLSAPAGGRTHDMKVLKQSRLLGAFLGEVVSGETEATRAWTSSARSTK